MAFIFKFWFYKEVLLDFLYGIVASLPAAFSLLENRVFSRTEISFLSSIFLFVMIPNGWGGPAAISN